MSKNKINKVLTELDKLSLSWLKKIGKLSGFQLSVLTKLHRIKKAVPVLQFIHLKGFTISRTQKYREISRLKSLNLCHIRDYKIMLK